MAKITCYLAGPFTEPEWRDQVISEVEGIGFYNPETDTPQGSIATFVGGDLSGVDACDVCFVYVLAGQGDVGAAIEASWAAAHGKLVVLCTDEPFPHPMLVGIARRVFFGLETGIKYLQELAEAGLRNEFQAAYAMWEEEDDGDDDRSA